MYGGLDIIKSYLPDEKLSISDLNNFNLFIKPSLIALFMQTFKLSLLISTPLPKKDFFSFKIDKIIQPDPVPISKKLILSFFL